MCFEVGGIDPSPSGVEPSLTCRETLKSCRKTPGKLVDVTDFERYPELRWLWDKEGRPSPRRLFMRKSFALRPNAPYSIDGQQSVAV